MAFTNGQNVQANDLNNFSVATVTTSGNATVGGDLAVGDDATVAGDLAVTGTLTVAGVAISLARNTCNGRLTLTAATPVTTADVTAATTIRWALYEGNQIALYSGTEWVARTTAELSIAVPATTDTGYDVFIYDNAGVPTLELTSWTNLTTRATALTLQDGVLVKTGATTRRYVGSFRTTGVSGQTEDSEANRYVWNYYHRMRRPIKRVEGTDSWTYTTATYRQANNSTSNQVNVFIGVAEVPVDIALNAYASNAGTINLWSAIGYDSVTVPILPIYGSVDIAGVPSQMYGRIVHYPAVGYHYYSWLERSQASATTTWYGDNADATLLQAGLFGSIEG
jgi:hypothetical protein